MSRPKLTEEERKERKRQQCREYYRRNKARIVAQNVDRVRAIKAAGGEKADTLRKKQCQAVARYRDKDRDKVRRRDAELKKQRRAVDPEWRSKQNAQCREWYAENADGERPKHRAWHEANRESANQKRATHYYEHREEDRPKRAAKLRQTRETSPVRLMLHGAKGRAKKKGLPIDLSIEYLESLWTGRCAITGIAFNAGPGCGPKFFSPSLDRIRPEAGYVAGNVRFILWAANAMKHDGTDDDVLMLAEAIVENRKNLYISNH